MTNTIYVRPVFTDESSVDGSETLSAAGHEDDDGLVAKVTMLSVIRMNCFSRPASAEEEDVDEIEDNSTLAVTLVLTVDHNRENQKQEDEEALVDKKIRRRRMPNPRLSNPPNNLRGEQIAAGWPSWLSCVASDAIKGWIPHRADNFEKLEKIGEGARSHVYKARDLSTGKIVALKKVRFDNLEPESVKLMAREIIILRQLDHPNVIKLEGLVTSRRSCCLYLVFEYMEQDLAGVAAMPGIKFTEPQVKCYMHQLLSGLDHCHSRGVLHRNINLSNLLMINRGVLKIAGFGSASLISFNHKHKQPMTHRVVSLWYRPPELLLGATDYGVGVDLWSTGCILAEFYSGKPIMPGQTEVMLVKVTGDENSQDLVEQLHQIFKLCGSPSEEYWRKSNLPHEKIFKPQNPYRRCIAETFKDFPSSSLRLIETFLANDPVERQTATAALRSEFFSTRPYACEPSSLQRYPPKEEMNAELLPEARSQVSGVKSKGHGVKKISTRDRLVRTIPASETNTKLPASLQFSTLCMCLFEPSTKSSKQGIAG